MLVKLNQSSNGKDEITLKEKKRQKGGILLYMNFFLAWKQMNVNEKKKKKEFLYDSENGAFALTMNTSLNLSVNSPRNLYVSKS